MKRQISFDYDKESGMTIATLKTNKGTFYGSSCKHPDDTFPASYSVGMNIAEARANINLCNYLLKEKRLEIKGLKRLAAAMPEDKDGYVYILRLIDAIHEEIYDLIDLKIMWKRNINTAIESRALYINSRTTNREEREKYLKTLGEAIHNLGELSKQDKED